ncbi:MAG: nitroreductase family protein [Candidatus Binatia bacterium]|nr:nitroreductase family protein [Candidatus Binatia bacterium]
MNLESTDHLLRRTRSVRKRLDLERPVPPELIEDCIDIAFQAPTGSNTQGWSVVVVTDEAKRQAIADLYRDGMQGYAAMRESEGFGFADGDPRAEQMPRVMESALYLGENLQKAPVMVLFCIEGRVEEMGAFAQASIYGSILPAAWSFMLAGRSRGLGMAWTTLHLAHEAKAAELLGIPKNVTQAVLFPVAYFTGKDFKEAKRVPPKSLTHWNSWGTHR